MNKLFSKIAALSVGLAMAIGVGVAVGQKNAEKVGAANPTISFVTNSSTMSTGSDVTIEQSGVTLTFSKISAIDASLAQNAKSSTITSSEIPGSIVSVKLYDCQTTASATDGSFEVFAGTSDSAITTSIKEVTGLNNSATDQLIEFSENYTFFKVSVGSARVLKISKIEVTYRASDPSKTTLTVKMNGSETSPVNVNYSVGSALFFAYDGETEVKCAWTSSDTSVATVELNSNQVAVVTFVKPGTTTLTATNENYNDGVFSLTINSGSLQSITVTGSMNKTEYTTAESWSADGLIATADYEYGYHEDVTNDVTWAFNPSSPTAETTSVVATATYNNVSGSIEQDVTVTVAHAGTEADPFTVAEGIAKCQEIGTTASGDWYVKGIISAITSTETDATKYYNATFNISDDGENSNYLIAYRIKYIGGVDFDAAKFAELKVGLVAVVHGELLNYKSSVPEFVAGSALVSLTKQSTGDIDVTFEPETNVELDSEGTFTASTTAANPVYTWSSENESVISVDASTGAYTCNDYGSAKIIVNVTSDDGNGSASAFVTVNGSLNDVKTVPEANAIAAATPTGETTSYYFYVGGYISEFDSDSNARALDITTLDEQSSIMVFVGKTGYAAFIEGMNLGDYLVVKAYIQNYSGTYELTTPVVSSCTYSAVTFSHELLDLTDVFCAGYDGVTDNKAKVKEVWDTLSGESKYGSLNETEVSNLVGAHRKQDGTVVEQAMARYDYLTGKYKQTNFITGRTPVVFTFIGGELSEIKNDNTMMIIIAISATTAIAFGVLLILKKKKHN